MPPQSGYGHHLLIQRQFLFPPISFFDRRAYGLANFGLLPKTEFFNGIQDLCTRIRALIQKGFFSAKVRCEKFLVPSEFPILVFDGASDN